jgi:hypothetical protein
MRCLNTSIESIGFKRVFSKDECINAGWITKKERKRKRERRMKKQPKVRISVGTEGIFNLKTRYIFPQ